MAHTIDTAVESGLFAKIHVSADDQMTFDLATALRVQPDFMRPHELSDDHAPLPPVAQYVLEAYSRQGMSFDEVWLLMACCRLLEVSDLKLAEAAFGDGGSVLIAVAEYPAPIEWAYELDDCGNLTLIDPNSVATRFQDIEPRYFDAGSIVVGPQGP